MISFKTGFGRFNFRVAGLIFHEGKLLIHRLKSDDFFALPGGRVEFMENTETTIIREMKEELNIWVTITDIVKETFYPIFIKDRLLNLPKTIEKFVEVDDISCYEYYRK